MNSTPISSPSVVTFSYNVGSPMTPATPTTPLAPGVQQRLLLKQTAIDTWSLKEQLGLASAVLRSGDQNWVSVSRQMKPFSDDGRPQDWFSQKNCALQYNLLLNKVETPRRKRGEKAVESVETPGEAIVRRLTADRIRELRKVIEAESAELMQLEEECKLLSDDNIDDEKLKEIEAAIEREEKEEAEKKAAHEKWLREREEKKQAILAALKAHSLKLPLKGAAAAAVQQAGAARRASTQSERSSFSDVDSPLNPANSANTSGNQDVEMTPKKEDDIESQDSQDGTSPLLSSLLKSPAVQSQPSGEPSPIKVVDEPTEEKPSAMIEETADNEKDIDKEAPSEPPKESSKAQPEEDAEMKDVEMDDASGETQSNIQDKAIIKEEEEEPESSATPSLKQPVETYQLDDDHDVDDDDDDEVIIKKEAEALNEDSDGKKQLMTPKPNRNKKISEVSEEDDNEDSSLRSRRDTRSKKVSERSDEAEDSPAPPLTASRSTRRSKKVDSSQDTSTEREESATSVENKRLSRIRETEAGRGRRGSGATTTSRSSSPVGSGDESEADQQSSKVPRSRKKSGRGVAPSTADTDSAPPSPAPSTLADVPEDEDWKKNALGMISDLKSHKLAESVFALLQDDNSVILKEMDLTLIKKNVENNSIRSNSELHLALHHMFLNAVMSLNSDTEEYENVMMLYRDCMSLLDEYRILSLQLKSPIARSTSKNRDKRDSSASGTSTPDDRRKRVGLDDTPVSTSNKRRKR